MEQLSAARSLDGYYGHQQLCQRESEGVYVCQVQTFGDDENLPLASFRQNISVAWSRYQLYKKTGDQAQLDLLGQDLAALVVIMASDNLALQTSRFNCLLMTDLARDESLPDGYRQAASDICRYADFETYPDSWVTIDQHVGRHPEYRMVGGEEFITDEIEVQAVVEQDLSDDPLNYFSVPGLTADINQLLQEYALTGQITEDGTSPERYFARRFLTRELFAALDQAAALEYNLIADDQQAAINEIDYLILTRETLQWWGQNEPDDFSLFDNDTCLLLANLNYYRRTYGVGLGDETWEAIIDRLKNDTTNDVYSVACALANHQLNSVPYNKQALLDDIVEINTLFETDDFSLGYLYQNESGEYINVVELNAWVAGVLAQ